MTGADVQNGSGGIRALQGAGDRVDDIVDVDEVARLLPVAVDQGWAAFGERGVEVRDHTGIRRTRILPRTEHVEKTQTDCG